VLIVDDEAPVRAILALWLQGAGHTTLEAADAEAALDVLAAAPVAVALCDLAMPGRGGEWLVSEIRSRFPTVAVVLITGDDTSVPRVSAQPGVVGYLGKPFARLDVLNAVNDALAWHRVAARKAQRDSDEPRHDLT
jgi:DNA-binding NtrC family response regulator